MKNSTHTRTVCIQCRLSAAALALLEAQAIAARVVERARTGKGAH